MFDLIAHLTAQTRLLPELRALTDALVAEVNHALPAQIDGICIGRLSKGGQRAYTLRAIKEEFLETAKEALKRTPDDLKLQRQVDSLEDEILRLTDLLYYEYTELKGGDFEDFNNHYSVGRGFFVYVIPLDEEDELDSEYLSTRVTQSCGLLN